MVGTSDKLQFIRSRTYDVGQVLIRGKVTVFDNRRHRHFNIDRTKEPVIALQVIGPSPAAIGRSGRQTQDNRPLQQLTGIGQHASPMPHEVMAFV